MWYLTLVGLYFTKISRSKDLQVIGVMERVAGNKSEHSGNRKLKHRGRLHKTRIPYGYH